MSFDQFTIPTTTLEWLVVAKRAAPVVLLAFFWGWETWRPFYGHREGRVAHAGRNLAIAVFNVVVVGLLFGAVTVAVADWAARGRFGLLHALGLSGPFQFVAALILLDGWMYLWHRANHSVPFLWRFHRMHHSDRRMDVTTATRFHLGEHVGSSTLRLGLIPVLGFEVWNLVAYDALVLAVIQFHHADISLGRWDRWVRWLVVTPDMHKVHHSDWRPETDSNFSTVLSLWDRTFGTFQMRSDPKEIVFGLKEFTDPSWQTVIGMLWTPLAETRTGAEPRTDDGALDQVVVRQGATVLPHERGEEGRDEARRGEPAIRAGSGHE